MFKKIIFYSILLFLISYVCIDYCNTRISSLYIHKILGIDNSYVNRFSSKENDPTGRFSYYQANLYFAGYKDIVSKDKAIDLLHYSAGKGFQEAQIHLARLYWSNKLIANGANSTILKQTSWSGSEISEYDKAKRIQKTEALKWLRKAIKTGSYRASYILGTWLHWIPTEEIPDALAHLEKAADAEYGPALLLLGEKYYKGSHVEKNQEKAFCYFLRSYIAGMEEAGLRLAKCYLYGTGVSQDIPLAKEILLNLGRHSYGDASKLLFQMEHDNLITVEPDSGVTIYNNEFPKWPNRERLDNKKSAINKHIKMVCDARDGNWKGVFEALHRNGTNINTQNAVGRTVLHYAVMQRDYATVRKLLREGANPNLVDASGRTPFSWAFTNGFYKKDPMGHDIAYDMLEHGAAVQDINDLLKFNDKYLILLAYDKWDISENLYEKDFIDEIMKIGDDEPHELFSQIANKGIHLKQKNKDEIFNIISKYIRNFP